MVNAAQLASYSQSKQVLLDSGTEHTPAHAYTCKHTVVDHVVFDALRIFQR